MIVQTYERLKKAIWTGRKSVTTTAAELFAKTARRTKRYEMIVYNDSAGTIYYGDSSVTTTTGMPIQSGDYRIFLFDPLVAQPIYFIAGSTLSVAVEENAI